MRTKLLIMALLSTAALTSYILWINQNPEPEHSIRVENRSGIASINEGAALLISDGTIYRWDLGSDPTKINRIPHRDTEFVLGLDDSEAVFISHNPWVVNINTGNTADVDYEFPDFTGISLPRNGTTIFSDGSSFYEWSALDPAKPLEVTSSLPASEDAYSISSFDGSRFLELINDQDGTSGPTSIRAWSLVGRSASLAAELQSDDRVYDAEFIDEDRIAYTTKNELVVWNSTSDEITRFPSEDAWQSIEILPGGVLTTSGTFPTTVLQSERTGQELRTPKTRFFNTTPVEEFRALNNVDLFTTLDLGNSKLGVLVGRQYDGSPFPPLRMEIWDQDDFIEGLNDELPELKP